MKLKSLRDLVTTATGGIALTVNNLPSSVDGWAETLKLFDWYLSILLQAAVTNALKEIPVQDFQASYDAWQNGWQRCIDAQGCYFEEY